MMKVSSIVTWFIAIQSMRLSKLACTSMWFVCHSSDEPDAKSDTASDLAFGSTSFAIRAKHMEVETTRLHLFLVRLPCEPGRRLTRHLCTSTNFVPKSLHFAMTSVPFKWRTGGSGEPFSQLLPGPMSKGAGTFLLFRNLPPTHVWAGMQVLCLACPPTRPNKGVPT